MHLSPRLREAPEGFFKMPNREAVAQEIEDFLKYLEDHLHETNAHRDANLLGAKGLLKKALPELRSNEPNRRIDQLTAACLLLLRTTTGTKNPNVCRITNHSAFTQTRQILARLLGVQLEEDFH